MASGCGDVLKARTCIKIVGILAPRYVGGMFACSVMLSGPGSWFQCDLGGLGWVGNYYGRSTAPGAVAVCGGGEYDQVGSGIVFSRTSTAGTCTVDPLLEGGKSM